MATNDEVDVVVIGAGLSGLVAARRLVQRGVESVLVLEAFDRVGGRVVNLRIDDRTTVDGGGTFVGVGQDRLQALADELGVDTFPTYDRGRTVTVWGGKRRTFRTIPYSFGLIGLDFLRAAVHVELAARRVDPDRPWATPNAAELDALSLQDFVDRYTRSDSTRQLWVSIGTLILGSVPGQTSLLAALCKIRSSGGLYRLVAVRGGAQERRFVGGSHTLALKMAAALGDRIRLEAGVSSIQWGDDHARVRTIRGDEIRARRVIVALSPADRRRIQFTPGLPEAIAAATDQMHALTVLRVNVIYDRPFWRDQNLNGQAVGDIGPARLTVDASPPNSELGVLTTYLPCNPNHPLAPTDRELADPDTRRAAILGCLVRYFGDRAADHIGYLEQDWRTNPFIAGCIPSTPPGLLTTMGPGHHDHTGALLWAGTEQSHIWKGYMDGAVRTGEHAAALAFGHLNTDLAAHQAPAAHPPTTR
ncbi:flavin monoamine oxidase family protein [Nocardia gipuzkoensis]